MGFSAGKGCGRMPDISLSAPGMAAWSSLVDSCRNSASASPTPLLASVWLSCWSSMDVYMRLCWLSNMPSCGVASRMLFMTMFMNRASNCCAAPLSASGEFWRAAWRNSPTSLTSMASFPVRLLVEEIMASDDFQLGAQ
ncbi:hypothetical protein AYR66_05865 [Noviherbaspirillum denitrificans]|uniref:Uncharacterized protein n=1 Tax=Noviherbaspirillum denitrificans TaxID=1968433 RepID=A0A254T934_9BURK|nr:hypothetical protein AYR66_05865 [Noviherbaspirillum denitrificans]